MNGVRVVLFQKQGAPIFIRAVFKAGSRYDQKGQEGAAHFLEHLMSNGRKVFSSKDLLAEYIESVGGTYGMATNRELLWVNTEIADKTDIDHAVKVLDATMCDPEFDSHDIEKERQVILTELKRDENNQRLVLINTVLSDAFAGSPFEHRVLGTIEALQDMPFDALIKLKQQRITSACVTFIVSGDIELPLLVEKLEGLTILSENKSTIDSAHSFTLPASIDTKKHVSFPSEQTFMYYGFPGAEQFTKDSLCLGLVTSIMAGGRASRLAKVLRYEKGLVYSVSPQTYTNTHSSILGVITDTPTEKVPEVVESITGAFELLRKDGVTQNELDFAKNKRIKSLKSTMQTSESWVDFHYYGECMNPKEYLPLDKFIETISSITLQDIHQAIHTYLLPEHVILVTCGK